jgi:hypothetical protein
MNPSARVLVVTETVDDYAVALAVAIAGHSLASWAPVLREPGESAPIQARTVDLHSEILTDRLFSREIWRIYQRLWYRWQSPRDFVTPMQWYLAALAGRSGSGSEHISETVDAWLQEQAALSLVQRAGHVREILGVNSDAELVGTYGCFDGALAVVAYAAIREQPFLWCQTASDFAHAVLAEAGGVTVGLPSRLPKAADRDKSLTVGEHIKHLPAATPAALTLIAASVKELVEQATQVEVGV